MCPSHLRDKPLNIRMTLDCVSGTLVSSAQILAIDIEHCDDKGFRCDMNDLKIINIMTPPQKILF